MSRKPKQQFLGPVTEELFLQTLMKHLVQWKTAQPEDSLIKLDVLQIFRNMCDTLRTDRYSRTAPMIKATCRELGIENSREAINSIFKKGTNHGTD